MDRSEEKKILILGGNSDVAKECIRLYLEKGYYVMAASRDLESIRKFLVDSKVDTSRVSLLYFDTVDFASHQLFYDELPKKPNIVVYAAGFLVQNTIAFDDFASTYQMINVNYAGALSILNLIAMDETNLGLERIIGLSSLSGVRGRKSNFVYGSTKAAFTQYLAGLRQLLKDRNISVNVMVIGYINTKINKGLDLNKNLMMEPDYVAKYVINAGRKFEIIPNWKWKVIYNVVKFSPEFIVSKLP